MSNMQFQHITFNTPAYQQELELRDIILRQPLGLSLFDDEDLSNEESYLHFGMFADDTLLGCAVVIPETTSVCKLRQLAVVANAQRRGIGRELMVAIEQSLRTDGVTKIHLAARSNVVGFYEMLGYVTEGEQFESVGIPHIKMWKTL